MTPLPNRATTRRPKAIQPSLRPLYLTVGHDPTAKQNSHTPCPKQPNPQCSCRLHELMPHLRQPTPNDCMANAMLLAGPTDRVVTACVWVAKRLAQWLRPTPNKLLTAIGCSNHSIPFHSIPEQVWAHALLANPPATSWSPTRPQRAHLWKLQTGLDWWPGTHSLQAVVLACCHHAM